MAGKQAIKMNRIAKKPIPCQNCQKSKRQSRRCPVTMFLRADGNFARPQNITIQCQLPEVSAVFQSEFLRIIQTAPHPNHPQKNAFVVRAKSCRDLTTALPWHPCCDDQVRLINRLLAIALRTNIWVSRRSHSAAALVFHRS